MAVVYQPEAIGGLGEGFADGAGVGGKEVGFNSRRNAAENSFIWRNQPVAACRFNAHYGL
jgi:hypothetical protein